MGNILGISIYNIHHAFYRILSTLGIKMCSIFSKARAIISARSSANLYHTNGCVYRQNHGVIYTFVEVAFKNVLFIKKIPTLDLIREVPSGLRRTLESV